MTAMRLTLLERLLQKTDRSGECWLWTASLTTRGYGKVRVNGRYCTAHRVAYELLLGPVPEGLELDHLCRVRRCINPAHLEAVTHQENVLRGASNVAVLSQQTECLRGHPFDEANTFVNSFGSRVCRTCKRERNRKFMAAKRAAAHKDGAQ